LRNQEEPEAPTAIELNKQRYKVQLQRTKDSRKQIREQRKREKIQRTTGWK